MCIFTVNTGLLQCGIPAFPKVKYLNTSTTAGYMLLSTSDNYFASCYRTWSYSQWTRSTFMRVHWRHGCTHGSCSLILVKSLLLGWTHTSVTTVDDAVWLSDKLSGSVSHIKSITPFSGCSWRRPCVVRLFPMDLEGIKNQEKLKKQQKKTSGFSTAVQLTVSSRITSLVAGLPLTPAV